MIYGGGALGSLPYGSLTPSHPDFADFIFGALAQSKLVSVTRVGPDLDSILLSRSQLISTTVARPSLGSIALLRSKLINVTLIN